MTVTVNPEQQLFIIPSGGGYSCLGFDVCRRRSAALIEWLRVPCAIDQHPKDSLAAYAYYESLMELAENRCTREKIQCPAELSPQLIGLEGKRVEVVTEWGETNRFWVGKSTGWLPIHLEITRQGSSGGCACSHTYKSVRVVREKP